MGVVRSICVKEVNKEVIIMWLVVSASLLIYHFDNFLWYLGAGVLCVSAVASVSEEYVGIITLPIFLYILASVPDVKNADTLLFIGLWLFFSALTIYKADWFFVKQFVNGCWWYISGIFVFVFLNYFVGAMFDVSFTQWTRGLIPFCFIAMSFIFFLASYRNQYFWILLFFSFLIASGLFSFRVVETYINEKLWESHWFYYEAGQWFLIRDIQSFTANEALVKPFITRVTLLVQQSTDLFVPIGIVWGLWGGVFLKKNKLRIFAVVIGLISLVAVTFTYTRSMLLAAFIIVLFMGLQIIFKNKKKLTPYILICVGYLSVFLLTVTLFSLQDIYLNRLFETQQTIEKVFENQVVENQIEKYEGDANITARLEEYKIAWEMFTEAPVFGQGFGISHEMSFSTGFGEVLTQEVGYIHNWLMYILMTSGLVGLFVYSMFYYYPIRAVFKYEESFEVRLLIYSTLGFMLLYASFFAVFRLLPFNILLGAIIAYAIHLGYRRGEECAV